MSRDGRREKKAAGWGRDPDVCQRDRLEIVPSRSEVRVVAFRVVRRFV